MTDIERDRFYRWMKSWLTDFQTNFNEIEFADAVAAVEHLEGLLTIKRWNEAHFIPSAAMAAATVMSKEPMGDVKTSKQ